jgi:hypothetical protein
MVSDCNDLVLLAFALCAGASRDARAVFLCQKGQINNSSDGLCDGLIEMDAHIPDFAGM